MGSHHVALREELALFATSPDVAVAIEVDFDDLKLVADVNGDVIFPAASLLKMSLAMTAEIRAGEGFLDLMQPVNVKEITRFPARKSVLRGMLHTATLSVEELVRIMLISSDELCTRALRSLIRDEWVSSLLEDFGFQKTKLHPISDFVSVAGEISAIEAVQMLSLATNEALFPITASALESSIMNSRIPLGASDYSGKLSHKTGSLPGVAHDVAQLETSRGPLRLAFLSRNQTDTVMTGYQMGVCTSELLKILDVTVSSSMSVVKDLDG